MAYYWRGYGYRVTRSSNPTARDLEKHIAHNERKYGESATSDYHDLVELRVQEERERIQKSQYDPAAHIYSD